METGILVEGAMTNRPTKAGPQATIKECAQLMKKHDVGSIVIVDGEKLLGIVTEYDMVRFVVAEGMDVNLPVTKVMITNLFTISPSADIYEATRLMNDKDIRHMPVVENGKFVGFLTMRDILKIQPDFYEIFYENHILNAIRNRMGEDSFDGYCSSCGNFSKKLVEYADGLLCPDCLETRNF